MKCIKTEDAAGHVLCHDMTQIIPGVSKGPRFRKGHIVTAEDHLITGGLGSAVAETLADAGIGVPFRRLGIPGEDFPPLGDCYELYAHFGYDPEGIKRAVRELLGK